MITNITVTQDNKISGSDLMAVFSPLIFICDVTYSGATPEKIYVDLYHNFDLLQRYKAIPYTDPTATLRRFLFIADSIIRSYMQKFDDVYNSSDVTVSVPFMTKEFILNFIDPDNESTKDTTFFNAALGSRQFSENPNMVSQYNNDNELIIGIENFPSTVYFYSTRLDSDPPVNFQIKPGTERTNDTGQKFFRKTFTNLIKGETTCNFYEYVGGTIIPVLKGTKTIRVKPKPCGDYKVLKYLNKDGQYRIYPFDSYYTISDKPEKIGDTNEFFASILNETNSKNIGYRCEREMILKSDSVPADELMLLADLQRSPRIYLYVGTSPSNTAADWLLLKDISFSDNIVRQPKKKFTDVSLTITLPETFNITML